MRSLLLLVVVTIFVIAWLSWDSEQPTAAPTIANAPPHDASTSLVNRRAEAIDSLVRADAKPTSMAIVVHAVDKLGKSLPGVTVTLCDINSRSGTLTPTKALGTTDAGGDVTALLTTGDSLLHTQVQGELEGYRPVSEPLTPLTTLRMSRAVPFRIQCLGDDAMPLAGVLIAASTRPIPSFSSIAGNELSGGGASGTIVTRSGADGTATLTLDGKSRHWLGARHAFLSSPADGITYFVQAGGDNNHILQFTNLWITGIQVEGPGKILSAMSSTQGAESTGLLVQAGRDRFAQLKARFPTASLASASFPADKPPGQSIFCAWHSGLGWIVETLQFQKPDDFQPLILVCDRTNLIIPPTISVRMQGPTGTELSLRGFQARTGERYGSKLDDRDTVGMSEEKRYMIQVSKSVGAVPTEVPPGNYSMFSFDTIARANLESNELIVLRPGDNKSIDLRFKHDLGHAILQIETTSGRDWGRAMVAVIVGEASHKQAIHQTAARNLLSPPIIPLNLPFEIQVVAPGYEPWTSTLTVTDVNAPITVMLKALPG